MPPVGECLGQDSTPSVSWQLLTSPARSSEDGMANVESMEPSLPNRWSGSIYCDASYYPGTFGAPPSPNSGSNSVRLPTHLPCRSGLG